VDDCAVGAGGQCEAPYRWYAASVARKKRSGNEATRIGELR
jgi:hypothetical protein